MPLDLVDRIRSFPLFMSAPDAFLAAIHNHLKPQIHSAHDHILTEGDDAKAMYWLVRGAVAVTSRDGEAVYAELKPGAFFGEIGVLMNIPRTATIVARTKCMLVVLMKEDLHEELPKFPEMEKAIRDEAQERLTILNKKRQEMGCSTKLRTTNGHHLAREAAPGEVSTGEVGIIKDGGAINTKKRKSPSPGIIEDPAIGGSALGSGYINVRKTLKELPLFSALPADILHFLGLSAQPKSYTPFTDIVRQGSTGNDIFFIVRGEAEVIHESTSPKGLGAKRVTRSTSVRPRLKQGQYFGEVAGLGLSVWRTATVRAITAVECLMIGGDALEELWSRCPPEVKLQVEETARKRYRKDDEEDIDMLDVDPLTKTDEKKETARPPPLKTTSPKVTFTTPSYGTSAMPPSPTKDESETRQPSDPDPYLSVDMENMRVRRRSSIAPPTPPPDSGHQVGLSGRPQSVDGSPLKPFSAMATPPEDLPGPSKRPRTLPRRPLSTGEESRPVLPDDVMAAIFSQLDILDMLCLRRVSVRWRRVLTEHPRLCKHVDLTPFNRKITDWSLAHIVAPFIGTRPVEIDISNCFHVTDEGFQVLWRLCGQNVKKWKMRSVWDVSASQILDMSENAKGLEEVDWSNCRKVGDNLLARVVGWVVPEPAPPREVPAAAKNVVIGNSRTRSQRASQPNGQQAAVVPSGPPPGTVIGCPKLRRLTLSYCKHITDRSMAHLAAHASNRLEYLSLTRCTSITDAGFQTWAAYRFTALTHLYLADCTYLSDNSIIALVNAAKNLTHLDLSFCCALSDTATEVVALGLPRLQDLRMAFCGSAVSDASLGCIALHLNDLRNLSVRGCVRVTGVGVENILEGCARLEWLDVSQCKNLAGWLSGGGVDRWGIDERGGKNSAALTWPISPLSAEEKSPSPTDSSGGRIVPTTSKYDFFHRKQHQPTGKTAKAGSRNSRTVIGGGGPVMKPIIPPRGATARRTRKPVRFVVEKGPNGLR
jgi:F-box/leucine-rich repeat protein 7